MSVSAMMIDRVEPSLRLLPQDLSVCTVSAGSHVLQNGAVVDVAKSKVIGIDADELARY